MTTAWMFPGQGSQQPGMGRELLQNYAAARSVLEEAEDLSRLPLNSLRERGPMASITDVRVAEPLLAAVSIGYAQVLLDHGEKPDFVAGYSAGEVVALFVAGAISRTDALRIAAGRGEVLDRFAETDTRMVAVSRVAATMVEEVIANTDDVELAGWNAPDHVTLVGLDDRVRNTERELVRLGAEISDVPVSGRWHSETLKAAADELQQRTSDISFTSPKIPIMTSVSGRSVESPAELRIGLARQVALPVQWRSVVESLRASQVVRFVEVGASRTLLGLLRRNWPDANAYAATSVEGRLGSIKPLRRMVAANG